MGPVLVFSSLTAGDWELGTVTGRSMGVPEAMEIGNNTCVHKKEKVMSKLLVN